MKDNELALLQNYRSLAFTPKTLATVPLTPPGKTQVQLQITVQANLRSESSRDGQLTGVELTPELQAVARILESSFNWIAENPWTALGGSALVIFCIYQFAKN